jgi:hypothetical protein
MESPISSEPMEKNASESVGAALVARTRKNQKPTEKAPQLQFITSTSSPAVSKGDVEVRRLIRAQARRSVGQKIGETTTAKDIVENGNGEVMKFDKKLHTSRFKLQTWSRKSNKKVKENEGPKSPDEDDETRIIIQYLEGRATVPQFMDPLNPLPVPLFPPIRRILHFCRSKYCSHESHS